MRTFNELKYGLKLKWRQMTGRDLAYRPTYRGQVARFGSSYGGWSVCPDLLGPDSIVYSIGVGADISFDLAVIAAFGCTVDAFDPTPRSIAWIEQQQLTSKFHFHPWGVAARDGEIELAAPENPAFVSFTVERAVARQMVRVPVLTVSSMMQKLGHSHLDVLKMDVEGMEYDVIEQILAEGLPVRQLLVEFHHNIYPTIPVARTRDSVERILAAGYELFEVSATNNEYHFLKRGGPK